MARRRKKKPESFMEAAAGPAAFVGVLIVVLGLAALAVAGKFNVWVYSIFALGILLFAVALAAKPTQVLDFLKSRQAKMGANASVMMLAFLGIIVAVNWISSRHSERLDLTKTKFHTLSPQTTKILKALKKDIKITAFYSSTGGSDFQRVRDLLDDYRALNQKHVKKVRVVDFNLNPTLALEYGVTSFPSTVIECPKTEKKETVHSGDEQDFTSAILKVTRDKNKKFYFLQGHGEKKWDGYDDSSLGAIKSTLEKQNHECAELNLTTQTIIPDDCSVLVIAGPKKRLADEERDVIRDYLEAKGRAMIMVDPPTETDPDCDMLSDILSRWGVTPISNVVVEPTKNLYGRNPGFPIVDDYGYHDITEDLRKAGYSSGLFLTAHLELDETEPPQQNPYGGQPPMPPDTDYEVHSLLKSSSDSWDVANYSPSNWEKRGASGPFDLAAVVTSGAPTPPQNPYGPPMPKPDEDEEKMRMVVVGDSDFATNRLVNAGGNGSFIINALNWLAEESDLISIQPKDRTKNAVTLSGPQKVMTVLLSMALLPLACLVTGTVVWWKRR